MLWLILITQCLCIAGLMAVGARVKHVHMQLTVMAFDLANIRERINQRGLI